MSELVQPIFCLNSDKFRKEWVQLLLRWIPFVFDSHHLSQLNWNFLCLCCACIQRSGGKKLTAFPRELSYWASLFRKLWLWLASTHISSSAESTFVNACTPRVRWPPRKPHRKQGQTRRGQVKVNPACFCRHISSAKPPPLHPTPAAVCQPQSELKGLCFLFWRQMSSCSNVYETARQNREADG